MRCRQRWEWSSYNREALQPVVMKPAFRIGRLWHKTQAAWSLAPNDDPVELCTGFCDEEFDRVRADYRTNIGAPMSKIEEGDVLDDMGLVMAMVNNYRNRWGTPLPDGFEMVSPEQTCVIPIPNTEHNCDPCLGTGWTGASVGYGEKCPECKGEGWLPHYLSGTLDGLIRSKDGRVWVLERKTYNKRPELQHLQMNDQFLAYLWMLRALDLDEVGGLAYDGAWKRKEPARGRTQEDLFLRLLLDRNKHELDSFQDQLRLQALDMAEPRIYPNRRWDGCWDCHFVEPCIAKEKGENFEYILKERYMRRPREENTTEALQDDDA